MTGFLLIAVSAWLLFLFVKHESKEKYPVFNISLIKVNKTFRRASLAALINYASTFPIGFLISLYLQEVKALDAQSAGMILIMQPVVQAALSPFAGKFSDKISPRYLALSGMALISVVLLAVALLLTPDSSLTLILIMLGLLGLGFAVFSSPNTNAIMGSVEKKDYSMASATTGTVRCIGQTFSMGITTLIISIIIGDKAITPDESANLMKVIHITFFTFAAFCALGVLTLSAREKRK
jgi:MFS family permease